MANISKQRFLAKLRENIGDLRALPNSQSLFESKDHSVRIYIRYSKVHSGNRTFYGLRTQDLRELQGRKAFIAFVWDEQAEPLLVPFENFEEVFQSVPPASDGQYKSQVMLKPEGRELYVAGAGRFNVESHFGWEELQNAVSERGVPTPSLTHSQVQTLVGAIGVLKGYQVWIPRSDRAALDWELVAPYAIAPELPGTCEGIRPIAEQIDVIWLQPGSESVRALYEVEHSTTIYSGLLRFNDVHLSVSPKPQFNIVADDIRRSVFVRQLNRPTFLNSGLTDLCGFLEYGEVYGWYNRLNGRKGE